MADKKIKTRKLRENTGKSKMNSVKLSSVQEKKERKPKSLDQVLDCVEDSRKKAIRRKTQQVQIEKIKSIKTRKIRLRDTNVSEMIEDQKLEKEDHLSITVMILILIICFVVGIVLGYMLYRIAINSSNALVIIRSLW